MRKCYTKISPSLFLTSSSYLPLPTITPLLTSSTAVAAPESRFFKQLKIEEHQFGPKKRQRFSYTANYTAALALPHSQRELEEKKENQHALLMMAKRNVIEHANRRVDLFFYTLIAYYKTALTPIAGHTDLQHGKGRNFDDTNSITQACHSSLTPSLLDETIYQGSKSANNKHKSLLCCTHLMHNLNATVELPSFVNNFDMVLETLCRQKCLDILGRVASGKSSPIDGITSFLIMMRTTLCTLKRQVEQGSFHRLLQATQRINRPLIDLTITGTLTTTFNKQTQTVSDKYIELLLRITPEERASYQSKPKNHKETLYYQKITSIKDEILSTRTAHLHY